MRGIRRMIWEKQQSSQAWYARDPGLEWFFKIENLISTLTDMPSWVLEPFLEPEADLQVITSCIQRSRVGITYTARDLATSAPHASAERPLPLHKSHVTRH